MRLLTALSFAPAVNTWLTNSSHPRILHVFDRACNLVNERGEVLSIVMPEIGNGPFNLVVDDVCFSDHIHHESQVSISGAQLTFGDLTIDTANAKLWNPRPHWEKLYAKRDAISKLLITNYQECGLDKSLTKSARDYSTTLIQSLLSNLSSSLANKDISTAKDITSKLAGLGAGLTPSGDDILLGAIYAAWIIHPPQVAQVLAQEIANTASPLTTSLSAAWLRAGARGEAGELWHDLFEALLSADSSAVQLQITKLLSVGHTSGADAMMGFFGSFVYGAK